MAMKTPGVYIVEKSAFPSSVVQVATAVPAFIGYTQQAMNGNTPLWNTPHRITTFSEFVTKFGGPSTPTFDLKPFKDRTENPYSADAPTDTKAMLPQAEFTVVGPRGPEKYELIQNNTPYSLYAAMRMFFLNGGGTCYVTAIGDYEADIDAKPMLDAITGLEKEPEVTMLVIPETTRLNRQNAAKVQGAMLAHCGEEMRNRFSILDVHGGYLGLQDPRGEPVDRFRSDIGTRALDYGAAYYPWLNSAVFGNRDFTFENIDIKGGRNLLISLMKRAVSLDKDITPEILKIGMADVKGDMTISGTSGETVKLLAKDLMAEDDQAQAVDLIYNVVGASDDMTDDVHAKLKSDMAGTLIRGDDATPIYSFSQAEIDDGQISFVHDATAGTSGEFKVILTDDEQVQTGEKTIGVVIGNCVVPKSAIAAGDAIEIKLTDDMDAGSVKLINADPVDKAAVYKENADVQTAQRALVDSPAETSADDKKSLKAAVKDAQAAAIVAVDGKTRTLPGIGTWSAAGDTITFAANTAFKGSEVAVQYITHKDGKPSKRNDLKILIDEVGPTASGPDDMAITIDKTMRATVPLYTDVMNAIAKYMNTMPPAAAMAGIYSATDNTRGVWKAPANVSVSAVTGPMVNIDHRQQENLNVSTTGKSINAIRPFVGEGTLVWGARTLDGNSLDWRYINVRRTMIMLQESIKLASKAYVFEPNTANTWVTMKAMIENFLTSVWKAGGLAGAVPEDAFSVHVGLGSTMTSNDILEGKLLISVFVAIVRPAEFIEITFTQQMQKS